MLRRRSGLLYDESVTLPGKWPDRKSYSHSLINNNINNNHNLNNHNLNNHNLNNHNLNNKFNNLNNLNPKLLLYLNLNHR